MDAYPALKRGASPPRRACKRAGVWVSAGFSAAGTAFGGIAISAFGKGPAYPYVGTSGPPALCLLPTKTPTQGRPPRRTPLNGVPLVRIFKLNGGLPGPPAARA